MDFNLPKELTDYLSELDTFIENTIKPLEQTDDNIRFFDHRREWARTDFDNGGLPRPEWEALLKEAKRKEHEVFEKLIDLWPLPQASLSLLLGDTHDCIVERFDITKALEPQEFKDGAVLIKQGEPRDAFFIIVQGELSCTQRRDRRCEDGPPAPPFWSASAPQRASAPARQALRPRL